MTPPLAAATPRVSAAIPVGLWRGAALATVSVGIGLTAAAVLGHRHGGLGAGVVWRALAVFGLVCVPVWLGLDLHRALASAGGVHRHFGAANTVTLARAGLMACLAGGIGAPLAGSGLEGWLFALAAIAAALDGVDGSLARRSGLASPFGARFDLEVDAALMLVLGALLVHLDKAGAWVLLAGALRYGFVGAAVIWPWLGQPLPPSVRRKACCAVPTALLVLALLPELALIWTQSLSAVALALLVASFALDIAWLARRGKPSELKETQP